MRIPPRVQAKGGFRKDLNMYVRSKWEANIARYLNFLKERGDIIGWKYENKEWEFPVKRGNRFYKCDFEVTNKNGTVEYWEVKGYMDRDSKVKLNRMAKHFPEVKIIIIGKTQYQSIKQWSKLIKGWEL